MLKTAEKTVIESISYNGPKKITGILLKSSQFQLSQDSTRFG
jgi:hypothetical protein